MLFRSSPTWPTLRCTASDREQQATRRLDMNIYGTNAAFLKISLDDWVDSVYSTLCSTETALIHVMNDLRLSTDAQNPSVLVLLDLSAAFHTVDHKTLIQHLECWVSLSGTVLE